LDQNVYARSDFKKGDLVRFCTYTDYISTEQGSVDWLYGIYVDSIEELHSYDGFTDCSELYDRILYSKRVQCFDHYWHIEKVS